MPVANAISRHIRIFAEYADHCDPEPAADDASGRRKDPVFSRAQHAGKPLRDRQCSSQARVDLVIAGHHRRLSGIDYRKDTVKKGVRPSPGSCVPLPVLVFCFVEEVVGIRKRRHPTAVF